MIGAHQATIFPNNVLVATSSLKNGSIRHPTLDGRSPQAIHEWCRQLDVSPSQTVGLYVTYADKRTYDEIVAIPVPLHGSGAMVKEGWVKADALVTQSPAVALLLPVADCNAVVYVDPVQQVLALAHLGWHSTVNNLASKLVDYLHKQYGSRPEDILIYNSPSVRVESYRFTYLDDTPLNRWQQEPYAVVQPDGRYAIDLLRYNLDQWAEAGVRPDHIEIVKVDTAKSSEYPSRVAGQDARFAVLAMMQK